MPFQLTSDYAPEGDQAQAIAKLVKSIRAGNLHQTLLGMSESAAAQLKKANFGAFVGHGKPA